MELQEEIKQLHLTTVHLRDSILNERSKYNELEKENSYLKTEVFKGEENLGMLKIWYQIYIAILIYNKAK